MDTRETMRLSENGMRVLDVTDMLRVNQVKTSQITFWRSKELNQANMYFTQNIFGAEIGTAGQGWLVYILYPQPQSQKLRSVQTNF